jgi:arylsulfatase A-like enzyme/Flp pilus assembly protein TadD
MERFLRAAAPFIAALGWLFTSAPVAAGEELNLLIITIDTLRADRLSCYDPGHARTPGIDGLAAKGTLFERAFAHDPETLPSHTNIFLGLTALAHGVSENSQSVVAPEFTTLAEYLRLDGYATGAFVSAFPLDSRFGLDQGFDVYDDRFPARPRAGLTVTERPAEKTVAAALKWLSARQGKWFCWVHLWDPHEPYAPPEPFAGRYRDDLYSGEVAYVDDQLGPLLAAVMKPAAANKALIVLTADHGEALGEHGEEFHGYFAYNSTLHVPLIMAGPGIRAGRAKDAVCHIDIFPTICDLLGLKKPVDLRGKSLLPLLKGRSRPGEPIYFEALEAHLNRGWAPIRGLIEKGMKYIESPIPEVYDLKGDFGESKNLAETMDLAAFKKRLEEVITHGASPLAATGRRKTIDAEAQEKLRSLGYMAAAVAPVKSTYGPEDDLKTLLPLERKAGLADRLRKQGQIAQSVKLLEDIIKERADFAKAYDLLYEIYRSHGLIDDAFRAYELGLSANPVSYALISAYGVALVMNGRYPKGAEILEKAIGLYDRDPRVWNSLGAAYGNMGDLEKAGEYFGRALDLVPEDAVLNENVGIFYASAAADKRDPELARRSLPYFDKAIAVDPTMASAHHGLAGALWLLKKQDEAILNWEKAVALDPKLYMSMFNLAVAYLAKGDKAKALQNCERYLLIRGSAITSGEHGQIMKLMDLAKRKRPVP